MNLLRPITPPYDALEWQQKPFSQKCPLVCQAWAVQGYGTPTAVYGFYLAKVIFYVGMWLFFCSFTPGLGGLKSISSWWLEPIAFQKAALWSIVFEGLGLGCGSGPQNACRKTCEFAGRAEAALIGRFVACPP